MFGRNRENAAYLRPRPVAVDDPIAAHEDIGEAGGATHQAGVRACKTGADDRVTGSGTKGRQPSGGFSVAARRWQQCREKLSFVKFTT